MYSSDRTFQLLIASVQFPLSREKVKSMKRLVDRGEYDADVAKIHLSHATPCIPGND